jgi:hypothetical protein
MDNHKDKTKLLNRILQIEKSIDDDITKTFSDMDTAPESELVNIAKKYAIGEKYREYYTSILRLQKDYFDIIIEQMTRYENERGVSREKIIECIGYFIGNRAKKH